MVGNMTDSFNELSNQKSDHGARFLEIVKIQREKYQTLKNQQKHILKKLAMFENQNKELKSKLHDSGNFFILSNYHFYLSIYLLTSAQILMFIINALKNSMFNLFHRKWKLKIKNINRRNEKENSIHRNWKQRISKEII